jgi:hypothetical protein
MAKKKLTGEWGALGGPALFKVLVEQGYDSVHNSYYAAVENGIRCVKCKKITELSGCSNCGSLKYKLGAASNGHAGLFCVQCEQGITSFDCECGCKNPINSQTLMTQVSWGACFIATAACGSPNASEVIVLRSFRDSILLPSRSGRVFVDAYYRYSPPIAAYIEQSNICRLLVRVLAIKPLAYFIRKICPTPPFR